jgi:hypothetical protein
MSIRSSAVVPGGYPVTCRFSDGILSHSCVDGRPIDDGFESAGWGAANRAGTQPGRRGSPISLANERITFFPPTSAPSSASVAWTAEAMDVVWTNVYAPLTTMSMISQCLRCRE